MKSTIVTYRNKKPYSVQVDKFHVVKNKKELNELIEKLLDIDAVSSPYFPKDEVIPFPLYLEVVNNDFPSLILVEKEVIVQAIKKQEKEIKKLKELL